MCRLPCLTEQMQSIPTGLEKGSGSASAYRTYQDCNADHIPWLFFLRRFLAWATTGGLQEFDDGCERQFGDVAARAGLTARTEAGGETAKKYIIETTGSGAATVDVDSDGWPDIFLVNGTTLEGFPKGKEPTSHLYHNNHDGTFTDVTQKSGAGISGWGQGVCAGDYDNDGRTICTSPFGAPASCYDNNGDGTFSDVTKKAGLWHDEPRWETGCAFLEYDRSGRVRPVRFAIRGPGFGKNAGAGQR